MPTPRAITGAAMLADFAVSRGAALPTILRHTGIREDQLRDPNGEITLEQEMELTRNVVTEVHDEPGLGLMAGLLCHPPSLGVLGFAVMSAPTLRRAVEIALRHADLLFTAARYRLDRHGEELRLVRDDQAVPDDLKRFVLERDIAAIVTIQQDLIPVRVPTLRAEVALRPHPVYEMFGAVFGSDAIVFGAPRSMLVWHATALDTPLPQANSSTARFYEQQCTELIQRRRERSGIGGRVRELLVQRGRYADQSHIAAALGVSVRTLRRRLAEEGTTFRELSNETVGLLAEELLVAGLTVEQVAERLGYASVSAFTAAFRAWKGQSPGVFGRVNRGRVSARG
ncbi:AraC family transcriptional regulator [Nocardia terpenica]|uniref:AraC family transcriptional regulator n=1 Tax=Nocardia terpenica TaxID=455432 RepID=A0A291RQS0_9NOCA|nr:AraC family transcriptional regulator [Nocardia terpenica]ATL69640.1 AraC family transcriptional regulator [Nocardia terpenica]